MNIPTNILYLLIILLSFTNDEGISIYNSDKVTSIETGEKIYTTGIGENDIIAQVSGMNMKGSMMACVNCHGNCGKGVTMSGTEVPDIRRSSIIKRHFSEDKVEGLEKDVISATKKAITMGLKPDGSKMHNLMPRYKMSIDDMNSLITYLESLGEDHKCKEGEDNE